MVVSSSSPQQRLTEPFLFSLASTSCGTLFRVSNGFIKETQDPLPTNFPELTTQASAAGVSARGSSARKLGRLGFVSDPSAKEDIDGLDIHFFRRFHILDFFIDPSKALQSDATIPSLDKLKHPALCLHPLNVTFVSKFIPLRPGKRVVIGRQSLKKNRIPKKGNGLFDSRVLSRLHAVVWAESNRVNNRRV